MISTEMRSPPVEAGATAAAVGYVVSKLGEADFHRIFKALYIADTLHLDRYGRMITWEDYSALTYGPVPMKTYSVMGAMAGNVKRGQESALTDLLAGLLDVESPYKVALKGEPDLEELSASDLECLDAAITKVKDASFEENTERTHDAAWTAAFKRKRGGRIYLEDLIGLSEDAELLRGHLADTLGRRAD